MNQLDIRLPGVAEGMMAEAGISPMHRGSVKGTSEWPDDDVVWRAAASSGQAWAAIAHSGEERTRRAVLEALAPFCHPGIGYRLTSELEYIIGEVDKSASRA